MEYGYQSLYPGFKVKYLLNDIKCDSTASTVRVHQDKYKKDFDTAVAFLTQ